MECCSSYTLGGSCGALIDPATLSDTCDGDSFEDCNLNTADGVDEAWYGQPCDAPAASGGDSDFCEEGTYDCVGGAQVCVVSGGLGPTSDDVTAEAFAALVGRPLVRDEGVVDALRERFSRRGFSLTESQLRQADRPDGAVLPGRVLVRQDAHGLVGAERSQGFPRGLLLDDRSIPVGGAPARNEAVEERIVEFPHQHPHRMPE